MILFSPFLHFSSVFLFSSLLSSSHTRHGVDGDNDDDTFEELGNGGFEPIDDDDKGTTRPRANDSGSKQRTSSSPSSSSSKPNTHVTANMKLDSVQSQSSSSGYQHTLSTHLINTPYQHTLSTHLVNISFSCTYFNTPCQHILFMHIF